MLSQIKWLLHIPLHPMSDTLYHRGVAECVLLETGHDEISTVLLE